jgi:peptidyl-tRNA hydrolase, PTH1 family
LLQFYKIDKSQLLVVHDDIDHPFGTLKLQFNRGHAGQNGVRNIAELLGNNEFARLKMGVGRPAHPGFAVADYVLSNFPKEQMAVLPKLMEVAADAIEAFILQGLAKASTQFNGPVNFE